MATDNRGIERAATAIWRASETYIPWDEIERLARAAIEASPLSGVVGERDRLRLAAIEIIEQGEVDIATGLGTFTADERDTILRALQASPLSGVVGERDRLREALEDVINPLGKLRRDAEAEGNKLGGMAHSIANDLGFVRSIARAALNNTGGQS